MDEKRDRIFISYAYADLPVAKRIAKCLESKNKKIFFDQIDITWGDRIVAKINSALSTSSMGIVILSNNFFEREMTQLELESMIFLMTNMEFRLLPLLHGIDYQYVRQQYPLLGNLRGEKADLDCDTLVSKLERANEILDNPLIYSQTVSASNQNSGNTTISAKEVSKNEMEKIFTDLRSDTTKHRKEAAMAKLRHYTDTKPIWKHSVAWDIISYLLDSDIRDGVYVIEYMIKLSEREYPNDLDSIMGNVRERFLPKLLNLIQPGVENRQVSRDSFRILRMIIEENTLTRYALSALKIAMNVPPRYLVIVPGTAHQYGLPVQIQLSNELVRP